MAQSIREKARIRQGREEDRPSEDDVAQQRLGWRGQTGRPTSDLMSLHPIGEVAKLLQRSANLLSLMDVSPHIA